MYVDYSDEQKALRTELRTYFGQLLAGHGNINMNRMEGGELYRKLIRQMGDDGWLAAGWPVEHGGQGRGPCDQLVFLDELRRAGAPFPFVTLNTVGPALMVHGTDEQKQEFLPRIAKGDVHFAIGYSEPDAGTDLASLKTTAVRDGDDYVINGNKLFTSGANDSDYIWLAARTDPDAPKHKGITLFIMEKEQPGFECGLIHTLAGGATCVTYYDNCRVPAHRIVGGLNQGWRVITAQLNHERLGLAAFGGLAAKHVDDVIAWAKEVEAADGGRLIDQPWAQTALAEAFARYEALKLYNWRMAWGLEQGEPNPAQASAAKVCGTELVIDIYRLLLEVVGEAGAVPGDSAGAVLHGDLEAAYKMCTINTFGGGVNEIQREIVAMFGLGLPRSPR